MLLNFHFLFSLFLGIAVRLTLAGESVRRDARQRLPAHVAVRGACVAAHVPVVVPGRHLMVVHARLQTHKTTLRQTCVSTHQKDKSRSLGSPASTND